MLFGVNCQKVKIYGDTLVIERFYGCYYLEDLASYSISGRMAEQNLIRDEAIDSIVRECSLLWPNLIREEWQ